MSTSSDLIIERADGSFARVYCHFDGYLEGAGAVLLGHYATQALAEAVVAPGDLSALDARCDAPPGHTHGTPVKGCSIYYGRDRGEKGVEAKISSSLATSVASDELSGFTYLWLREPAAWFVVHHEGDRLELEPLHEALDELTAKAKPLARPASWRVVTLS